MTLVDPGALRSMFLVIAAVALLKAATHDLAVRTVPNLVSVIVAGTGLGLNVLDGQIVRALAAGAMVFAGAWFCWRRGWLGGGDVKLFAACALLVPPDAVLRFILSTTIAGGGLALIYVALSKILPKPGDMPARPNSLITRVLCAERRRIRRRMSLPYACAICAGVLLTLIVPFADG
jgi:prepilin peptidase CpaA